MTTKRSIFVLLPTGTRAEAEAAKAALGHASRSLAMGSAHHHTPGQRLAGDVVVIGPGAGTAEADATGQVYRVASMEELKTLDITKPPQSAAEQQETAKPEPELPPEAVDEPSAPDEPRNQFESMSRIDLIQYGARNWPGRERWATMETEQLRTRIMALSAG